MLELLKFSVKGFKGFKDEITLDLTDKREQTTETKGLAIILGKEGAGRTSLAKLSLILPTTSTKASSDQRACTLMQTHQSQ